MHGHTTMFFTVLEMAQVPFDVIFRTQYQTTNFGGEKLAQNVKTEIFTIY